MDDQRIDRKGGKRIVGRILLWLMPILFVANAVISHLIDNTQGIIICDAVIGCMLIFVVVLEVIWRQKN